MLSLGQKLTFMLSWRKSRIRGFLLNVNLIGSKIAYLASSFDYTVFWIFASVGTLKDGQEG